MATAQHSAAPPAKSPVRHGVEPLRAGEGYSFVWRKLHSLSGIIPIGAFLLEHLLSNFEAIHGPAAYAAQVKFLNSLPLVRVLEWAFIGPEYQNAPEDVGITSLIAPANRVGSSLNDREPLLIAKS